jgi:sugar transferase (PEP-CTERM/EpsH1 system associated)
MTSPPLIVHVVFRLDFGGLENGVVNLINGLSAGRFRHVVVSLTDATQFARRLREGVPVYTIGKRPGKDPLAYWRLFRLLRRLKPTAVHTRNFGTLDCTLVAWLAGVPIRIHGEHGWDVFDPRGENTRYRRIRRVLGRLVKTFVAVSDELRDWLLHDVRIPANKVIRIRNGVDLARFRPRGERLTCSLPAAWGGEGLIIGSITRFSAIKDPLNLVTAFIALRRDQRFDYGSAYLVMPGDGDLRAAALAQLEDAGLSDAAWLPGSRDDVPALLRSMDVFVLASLREGISNTILEAMASGLPVVATATGGNSELVVATTGTLVPPGDSAALAEAIGIYLRDPGLRARHGARARARAESQFSIAAMYAQYQALYDRLLTAEDGS